MPDTWEAALQEYRYPVDLTEFKHRCEYLRWFRSDDSPHTGMGVGLTFALGAYRSITNIRVGGSWSVHQTSTGSRCI